MGGDGGGACRGGPGRNQQLQLSESESILTTHMPFHAAISVATPIMKPMAESTRQPRPALLRHMRMAQMIPPIMPATPRPRAKMTRGLLPLQMVQRMKLGWA